VRHDPVTGFIRYHCRALGLKWTTLPSALLMVCDSVLQSCDHTYVYAELRSQSMATMDYLVATAQDDIHATIKSTRYCVVRLTPPVHNYATREPHSLYGCNDKRPDGATQIPWKRGPCLAWDATCPNTYAQSYVQANSRKAGSAATGAELKKLKKYQDISAGVDFIPVAIDSSGVWGQHAMKLISKIGRRLSEVSHEQRSTSFLRQRLSVVVQRGNASCIIGTLQVNSSIMNKL